VRIKMDSKCPKCGKFTKDVYAIKNGFDDIVGVYGTCTQCGKVDLSNNEYDYSSFESDGEIVNLTQVQNENFY
jgi:uncharacterized OB-fold protein